MDWSHCCPDLRTILISPKLTLQALLHFEPQCWYVPSSDWALNWYDFWIQWVVITSWVHQVNIYIEKCLLHWSGLITLIIGVIQYKTSRFLMRPTSPATLFVQMIWIIKAASSIDGALALSLLVLVECCLLQLYGYATLDTLQMSYFLSGVSGSRNDI